MAKNLSFSINKKTYSAAPVKVDRDKVYGFVEQQVLDKNGNLCTTGNLLDDGKTLILAGATALKTVTGDNIEVNKKSLKTVYMDGTDAVLVPSSYDTTIVLQKASLNDLFNLEVSTVYQLTWEEMDAKKAMLKELEDASVYRFIFNYRADYEGADALVIGAQNEVFIITGRMLEFEFLQNKTLAPVVAEEVATEEEEEIDFGML